jgi:hypothetical protein
MYYYASPTIAFRRKSSHSPVSPTSQHASPPMHHPTYSSSLVESPVSASFPTIPRSPHTPAYGESLPLVQEDEARFESVGSQAPLIRDFAAESRGGGSERGREEGEGETEQGSSLGFLDDDGDLRSTPLAPPIKDRSERPIQRIPPAGIHDAYVGRFLSPLDPPAESRAPPLVRSNSAPGVPQTNAPGTSLLPSALADEGGVADVDDCGKPIFEIFDAELVGGAKGMVRALKGHLEEVLKVQEEVGRMHLALEGLGPFGRDEEEQRDDGQGEDKEKDQDEGESVAKRQQGVEEIMDRVIIPCTVSPGGADTQDSSVLYQSSCGLIIPSEHPSFASLTTRRSQRNHAPCPSTRPSFLPLTHSPPILKHTRIPAHSRASLLQFGLRRSTTRSRPSTQTEPHSLGHTATLTRSSPTHSARLMIHILQGNRVHYRVTQMATLRRRHLPMSTTRTAEDRTCRRSHCVRKRAIGVLRKVGMGWH